MKTEERIVSRALEMFNEKGIEYVGLREISADLGIRVGNVTYYFPTKDDLVNRLSLDLNKLNSKVFKEDPRISISGFIEMIESVFQNHLKYRCLVLSFVHLIERNKPMSARYKKTQNVRNSTLKANVGFLIDSGYLDMEEKKGVDFLVSTLALIIRFWISEARISLPNSSTKHHVNHYLSMIVNLLLPYTSSTGRNDLLRLLPKYE